MHFLDISSGHERFVNEYCGSYISRHILVHGKMFIAGGSLVSFMDGDQVPRDIDIYVPNYEPDALRHEIERNMGSNYELLSPRQSDQYGGSTANYLYLRYNRGRGMETGMQFIFRPLCDPLNTLCGFDIDLCKIALIGGTLIQGRCFPRDFSDRLINLDVVTKPLRTLERINKYINRGFSPTSSTSAFMRSTEEAIRAGEHREGESGAEDRPIRPTAGGSISWPSTLTDSNS